MHSITHQQPSMQTLGRYGLRWCPVARAYYQPTVVKLGKPGKPFERVVCTLCDRAGNTRMNGKFSPNRKVVHHYITVHPPQVQWWFPYPPPYRPSARPPMWERALVKIIRWLTH